MIRIRFLPVTVETLKARYATNLLGPAPPGSELILPAGFALFVIVPVEDSLSHRATALAPPGPSAGNSGLEMLNLPSGLPRPPLEAEVGRSLPENAIASPPGWYPATAHASS